MALEALKQYAQEMGATVEGIHTAPQPAKSTQEQAIAAAYQRQQDAIKRTEQLQHSLIKGLRGDAQPVDLLLQAVEIIGLMTGETVVLSGLAKEYAGRHGHADGGGCT
ncbi:MAG: hypothetical protein BWY65_02216 [Firmicutes bacterium ADurb.Bin373]|nr:MAG: hypothetical protein BWY65_02216 [Firmicutes bacterium ADurb.Bin373]